LVLSALGVTAQENAGIAAACGDVICFTDDDVLAPSDWLERLEAYYNDSTVGGVGGRDVVQDHRFNAAPVVNRVGQVHWFGRLAANHHRPSHGVREVDFLKGCNMSFRREFANLIDHRLTGQIPYGFEIDMGLSARDRGARLVYDPELTVDHYSSSQMSAHQISLGKVLNHNHTYILLKHLTWPRRAAFLAYTFLIGDRDTIGLMRVPMLAGRPQWTPSVIAAHFRGKLAGLCSFWAWLRTNPSPAGHDPNREQTTSSLVT
jgi:GT2 family glycosyltransferase